MITTVDIGATKTLVAQFGRSATPLNRTRFETQQDAANFIQTLTDHLDSLKPITALSVGLAGQITADGNSIAYCGNLPWRNISLKKTLAQRYNCPVYLQNDAVMAGLGEINALDNVPEAAYYLSLGTGIGGAIIVNGKLVPGLTHGEPGHMPLLIGGQWHEWEDVASGNAIVEQFGKLAKDITSPQDWQTIAENLALGLAPIIVTLQPQVIIVGGGVGRYFEHFGPFLGQTLRSRLPGFIALPPLLRAKHPDDAVLYGCYHHVVTQ